VSQISAGDGFEPGSAPSTPRFKPKGQRHQRNVGTCRRDPRSTTAATRTEINFGVPKSNGDNQAAPARLDPASPRKLPGSGATLPVRGELPAITILASFITGSPEPLLVAERGDRIEARAGPVRPGRSRRRCRRRRRRRQRRAAPCRDRQARARPASLAMAKRRPRRSRRARQTPPPEKSKGHRLDEGKLGKKNVSTARAGRPPGARPIFPRSAR